MNASSIIFDPLLSAAWVAAAAVLATVVLAVAIWRGLAGWPWRLAATALVLLAIANPSVQMENRTPLSDIVVVVTDESASQRIGDRTRQTATALATLTERIGARPGTEIRQVTVGDDPDNGGTRAMTALGRVLPKSPATGWPGSSCCRTGKFMTPSWRRVCRPPCTC